MEEVIVLTSQSLNFLGEEEGKWWCRQAESDPLWRHWGDKELGDFVTGEQGTWGEGGIVERILFGLITQAGFDLSSGESCEGV